MALPATALSLLLLLAGCNEPRVRPGHTGSDDTDTDTGVDTDTDPVRPECSANGLDQGWAFETPPGFSSHQVSPLGDGRILLATPLNGRPRRGGVFLLDVEDWRAGTVSDTVEVIDHGGLLGGYILQAPLNADVGASHGFGTVGGNSDFENTVLTWTSWPGPGTDLTSSDGRVEVGAFNWQGSQFADVDADGITDVVLADHRVTGPEGQTGVVYGPLVGAFGDSDVEPLALPRWPGMVTDWDDDGYEDSVGHVWVGDGWEVRAWLGPLSRVDEGDAPDVRISGGGVVADGPYGRDTLADLDGDGWRDLWMQPGGDVDQLRSVSFPGTGAFDWDEEAAIVIDNPDSQLPAVGDFDGDGAADLLLRTFTSSPNTTDMVILPGPLAPGTYSLDEGLSGAYEGTLGIPNVLGDLDGDGRDDFVIENTGSGHTGEVYVSRSVLLLGCPDW